MTFGGATSATATLAQKIEAAFSTNFASSTGEILAFQDSGNTYIVVNVDNTTGFDAGDQVIALEGLIDVTALSNSASAASTIWIV